jgi:hypothetical protein
LGLNLREALATASRALTGFLINAGVLVACGFLVLLEFAALLFVLRRARIGGPAVVPALSALIVLGGWLTVGACRRFILFRSQAAMLLVFAGAAPAAAAREARLLFPTAASWATLGRRLQRALLAMHRSREPVAARSPGAFGRLAEARFRRPVLALAFSRDRSDMARALSEGLALYWLQAIRSRRLARNWLGFSAAGLALLFVVLALANILVFSSAGAPLLLGIALAAASAWPLHQAFFAPLALAGMSAALLAETRERTPDPALCEKIAPLLTP